MEQDRDPRNKPTHLWSVNLPEEGREYTMAKKVSLVSGSGKTEELHVKQWDYSTSYNIYKNKLKVH